VRAMVRVRTVRSWCRSDRRRETAAPACERMPVEDPNSWDVPVATLDLNCTS